jgi:glycosyltransferase involved in cell wall biosynthesis
MNILYFSPRECWPLTTGARLRDYYLARELARNASVTYLGMRAPQAPPEAPPPSEAGFAEVAIAPRERAYGLLRLLRGAAGPLPVTILNYWSHQVAAALERILRSARFDTVQIEGVHLLPYVALIRKTSPRAAVIADWHNIESEILTRYSGGARGFARRIFARRTAVLTARAEDQLLSLCACHTVSSARERDKLHARNAQARIEVVPNGVDVEYYAHVNPLDGPRQIVFVGSMDYHANVDAATWMVREIWPTLKLRLPALQFIIVGRKPTPEVKALAGPDIVVTGTVEDTRPFYQRALAAVVPLRIGSGTRLKILEAMAAGVPVVSTRLGAEGLDVADGENILIADRPADFAATVQRLAVEPPWRNSLIDRGRQLVAESYDWQALGRRLYQIHCAAASW